MKCIYCGAELAENSIYCSQCGKEAQMVVGESVLEDEYLNSLIGSDNRTIELPNISRGAVQKPNSTGEGKAKVSPQKNNRKTIILCLILLVFVVGLILLIVCASHANSFDYQRKKAQAAASEGDVDRAIEYYENAIRLDQSDVDSRMELAQLYKDNGQNDGAKVMYMEVVRIDAANKDAYRGLLELYEAEGDTDAIVLLSQTVKDDSVLEVFADYMVTEPIFSVEGGTYDHYLHVELSAPEGTTIYYTTDRTDPIVYGKVYALPIDLSQMKSYTISAVAVNEKGVYSSVVTKEYEIAIPAPDLPVIFPDGGEFSQETFVLIEVPEGCNAYYTWDGSDPNILSTQYTEPFAVPKGNNVLSVMIIDPVTEQYSEIYRQYFTYYP